MVHTIWIARASYLIDKTFVYTNSPEMAKLAFDYEVEPIMRPEETATNTATDLDWVLAFLKQYKEKYDIYPQKIVHLRTTTPLREVKVIDSIIAQSDEDCSSVRSIERISEAPEKTFRLEKGYLQPIFSSMSLEDTNLPNQIFKNSYRANGYCDIIKPQYVLENNKLHGDKILGAITPNSPEIDVESDFKFIEFLMRIKNG
jgi:CMP-N-acetylneuraminic acid synthetase